MISFLVALAVVVAFAVTVYRYAPNREDGAARLFERYRPHAPMADWSMSYYEEQRQYSELAAIRARQAEAACPEPATSPRPRLFGRRAVQF
ncbi:hypothetical protein NDR87_28000 [Nocardia sp. CDC159]|uniref:Uncharacterized protein n=1 Tax=Nocardia pulmonis TaxID=2951408 RepID=A0A9X2EBK9_9NOCA|nr:MULTISPECIES: hypothetical protein [Nocardia]MCM6777336.1 hypothetical protein [Nocardia pulmonis]MCM6790221.1 hypothetical protein [Nocardia sp. CDC159]